MHWQKATKRKGLIPSLVFLILSIPYGKQHPNTVARTRKRTDHPVRTNRRKCPWETHRTRNPPGFPAYPPRMSPWIANLGYRRCEPPPRRWIRQMWIPPLCLGAEAIKPAPLGAGTPYRLLGCSMPVPPKRVQTLLVQHFPTSPSLWGIRLSLGNPPLGGSVPSLGGTCIPCIGDQSPFFQDELFQP